MKHTMTLILSTRTKVLCYNYILIYINSIIYTWLASALILLLVNSAMTEKIAADAFYNGEIENEIRFLVLATNPTFSLTFKRDSDREETMEMIETIRSCSIYTLTVKLTALLFARKEESFSTHNNNNNIHCYYHYNIGCGTLWVTDGIWKLVFPHCMHRLK